MAEVSHSRRRTSCYSRRWRRNARISFRAPRLEGPASRYVPHSVCTENVILTRDGRRRSNRHEALTCSLASEAGCSTAAHRHNRALPGASRAGGASDPTAATSPGHCDRALPPPSYRGDSHHRFSTLCGRRAFAGRAAFVLENAMACSLHCRWWGPSPSRPAGAR